MYANMAQEALLISENAVKEMTGISDNVAGQYLRPSIREAQERRLRSVLGQALTSKLKDMVAGRTIADAGNVRYKALLDEAQYFLAYASVAELIPRVSYKVANAGAVKTPDEKVENAGWDEVFNLRDHYTHKADAYCRDLQRWVLDRRADYPELTENDCHEIRSQLYSAASCGIWLGGPRGKRAF